MRTTLSHELDLAASVAIQAGQILMGFYKGAFETGWKGPDNPVTSADREASAFISGALLKAFPGDGILSEEDPPEAASSMRDRVWVIDPMDGTKEFMRHIDEFAVMIGLLIAREPVLGVVYQPVTGKLYCASSESGTVLKQGDAARTLHVSSEDDPGRMIAALSRSHHDPDVDSICRGVGITQSLVSGSLGLKAGLICEGRAHVYIHTGTGVSLWDTCAPQVLLTEAGGAMTDLQGHPLQYDPSIPRHAHGVVASTGVIHRRFVEEIAHVRSVSGR